MADNIRTSPLAVVLCIVFGTLAVTVLFGSLLQGLIVGGLGIGLASGIYIGTYVEIKKQVD